MSDLPILKLRLAEAEMARHQIALGKQLVTLSFSAEGNNSMQYGQASLPALERYIAGLKAEIAVLEGGVRRRAFTLV